MNKNIFISILLVFVLLTGTASAKIDILNGNGVKSNDIISQILRALTIQPLPQSTFNVVPSQTFPFTYQFCSWQGTYNEVSEVITVTFNGVILSNNNYAIPTGTCYNPITIQITAPATPGTYYGSVKQVPTFSPPTTGGVTTASFTVNVAAATPVATTVVVTPATTSIITAATSTLAANVYDQNGAIMIVTPTWTTSNAAIATVNPSGVVTGVSVGTATITASYGGKSGMTTITVTAPVVTVTTVTVTPGINTIEIGTTKQLAVTITDQNGAIITGTPTWVSNNPAAATVSSSGLVTGMSIGSSIITASYGGKSGSAIFQVNAPGVIISPPTGWAALIAALWAFLRTLFPFLPAQI